MKVLYAYQPGNPRFIELERNLVARINAETEFQVDLWDWGTEFNISRNPDAAFTQAHPDVMRPFHEALRRRSREVDAVLIAQTGGVPPELMASLETLVIYNTADDPDSSSTCSFPYLQAADVIAHAGVSFDATTTMGDALRRRGARRALFFPLGFYEEHFPPLQDFDATFARRDIPLVYIGHLKRGKLERLMRRHPEMVVHANSLKWKHKLYLLLTTGRLIHPYEGHLFPLYQRCQVGINLHITYGPSNIRCYQLPACGVAQVLDCPEGADQLYRSGEEVLVYHSLEEAEEQIQALRQDEALRYRIARNGYQRAREDYDRRRTFERLLRDVQTGLGSR